MATYEIEFGALGDTRPVPPLTVRTTDPNTLSRTVVDHARPYIAPALTEMGRPELVDSLFRVNRDRTMGQFLYLDLAGGKSAEFLPARITVTPERIQRKRTAGWTSNGAKYVGRGTRWGNPCTQVRIPAIDGSAWEREGRSGKKSGERHPFKHPDGSVTWHLVQDATREQAVAMYREWLAQLPSLVEAARTELAGRDLMCWCPLVDEGGNPVPCHADVLLAVASGEDL